MDQAVNVGVHFLDAGTKRYKFSESAAKLFKALCLRGSLYGVKHSD